MTLEEAIEHCKEVAKEKRYECAECTEVQDYRSAEECNDCAEAHKQLAEWLTELKQRKENKSHWIDRDGIMICEKCGAEFSVNMPFCGMCGAEMG